MTHRGRHGSAAARPGCALVHTSTGPCGPEGSDAARGRHRARAQLRRGPGARVGDDGPARGFGPGRSQLPSSAPRSRPASLASRVATRAWPGSPRPRSRGSRPIAATGAGRRPIRLGDPAAAPAFAERAPRRPCRRARRLVETWQDQRGYALQEARRPGHPDDVHDRAARGRVRRRGDPRRRPRRRAAPRDRAAEGRRPHAAPGRRRLRARVGSARPGRGVVGFAVGGAAGAPARRAQRRDDARLADDRGGPVAPRRRERPRAARARRQRATARHGGARGSAPCTRSSPAPRRPRRARASRARSPAHRCRCRSRSGSRTSSPAANGRGGSRERWPSPARRSCSRCRWRPRSTRGRPVRPATCRTSSPSWSTRSTPCCSCITATTLVAVALLSVRERVRDYGVLKAIGSRRASSRRASSARTPRWRLSRHCGDPGRDRALRRRVQRRRRELGGHRARSVVVARARAGRNPARRRARHQPSRPARNPHPGRRRPPLRMSTVASDDETAARDQDATPQP